MTEFVGNCSECVGLCCVALTRTKAGGFGADIPAGTACHHLQHDNLCRIHPRLREEGWAACTVFDCFGAGQQITQVTFAGDADWRRDPQLAASVFSAFHIMRHLMEMRRLLTEAHSLADGALAQEVFGALTEVEALTVADPESLAHVDVGELRDRVGPLLERTSESYRRRAPKSKRFGPRAQLMGAKLRGLTLDDQCLRSALLIAADLRGASLNRTDLLGADLRDAQLGGADLRGAIFLTQQQVDTARGDRRTILPAGLRTPDHWGPQL